MCSISCLSGSFLAKCLPPSPPPVPFFVASKQEAFWADGVAHIPSRREQGCCFGRFDESTRIVIVYAQVQGRPRTVRQPRYEFRRGGG